MRGGTGRGIYLKSIGCRTNQQELDELARRFAARGYRICDSPEQADIAVINGCSVTKAAEAKTRRAVNSCSRANPGIRICVTGCTAQRLGSALRAMPAVRWVVGNGRKESVVRTVCGGTERVSCPGITPASRVTLARPAAGPAPPNGTRTRAFLKIQEGCDNRCTFCIVPVLRGPSRSLPLEGVREAFGRILSRGYKEIVLTGTHIGQYRTENGGRLTTLLETLCATEGDFRIRLSSLEPAEMEPDLLEMIATDPRMCDHIHCSVQSISGNVLAAMGRPVEGTMEAMERVNGIRRRFPNLCLGGDFIVGFPGERDRDFEQTVRAATAYDFSYGHVFRYSPRPGTAAARMAGRVAERTTSHRSQRLRDLLRRRRSRFAALQKDAHHRIIVERVHPIMGITSNYIRVMVHGGETERNRWLAVRIAHHDEGEGYCIGRR